ncbi:MAG TPA: lipid-A-disaccharide synthase [Steroidobacteraceae bacterium]|nr:lipid-A-disaccharide synthase [Steroidobacteraceae bacterium]
MVTTPMEALRVAIVAGEHSGDALGAALIRALRSELAGRALEVRGVAGPAMRAAGCQALADAHELAVMGLIEPLRHLPRLLALRSRLLSELLCFRPHVFIGVDAPAFNLTLAGRFRAQGIRTVQYVSPQIWAWRQGRARKIARRCDLVLCLLPFEPAFYAHYAVHAQFVGHPLADQVPLEPDVPAARAALGLADRPVLALLPGSRLGEVQRLSAPFLLAAAALVQAHPGLQVMAAMANRAVRDEFEHIRAGLAAQGSLAALTQLQILDGQARTALTAADVALVASGTASLEALLCRCPMVVAYRVSALTAALVRSFRLVRLARFSLPNLLAGEALAPEFFQEAAIADNLWRAADRLLTDTARRDHLKKRFRAVHELLRADGATRAAQAVLALLGGTADR